MRRVLLAVVLLISLAASAQMFPFPGPGQKPAAAAKAAYTDDFNRASLGTNWVLNAGTAGIYSSTEFNWTASASPMVAYYNATFAANQYAEVKLTNLDNRYQGVAVRISGTSFYYFWCTSTACSRGLYTNGTQTWTDAVATASFPLGVQPTVGDTLRIEVSGTTLTYKVNGSALVGADAAPITDSALASGNGGLAGTYHTAGRMDNWAGGDL